MSQLYCKINPIIKQINNFIKKRNFLILSQNKENKINIQQSSKIYKSFPNVYIKDKPSKIYINKHCILFSNNICYTFTSSSNPTQVSLLEQVEAKVYQVIKKFKPSLFQLPPSPSKQPQQLPSQRPIYKLTKTTPFAQMGFDSLDVTELIVTMQQMFGIQLTDIQARSISNINMAIDIFYQKMNAIITNKIVQRHKEFIQNANNQHK